MSLPSLEDDQLHVLVFGPGIGELVMVRVPPGDWLVIDGCSSRRAAYAPMVLEHYGVVPTLVVLTHPHQDHARGVSKVIEKATSGEKTTWPRIGMLPLFASGLVAAPAGTDPAQDYDGGVTEQARATISDRWERHPPCAWDLAVGTTVPLGEATVLAASPAQALVKAAEATGRHGDVNTLATALVVEWGTRRLLLGSDLLEQPGNGWTSALTAHAPLATHDLVKVPHHGSAKALHAPALASAVTAIVTPFASEDLPRFDANGGVAVLHGLKLDVVLTALPRAHKVQPGVPITIARSALEQDPKVRFDPPTAGFPDCFVCASFDRSSSPPRLLFGAGSVRVTA